MFEHHPIPTNMKIVAPPFKLEDEQSMDKELVEFLETNKDRQVIYIAFGTTYNPSDE